LIGPFQILQNVKEQHLLKVVPSPLSACAQSHKQTDSTTDSPAVLQLQIIYGCFSNRTFYTELPPSKQSDGLPDIGRIARAEALAPCRRAKSQATHPFPIY
jgi:hypothetical protein